MTVTDWETQCRERRSTAEQALRDVLAQLAERGITRIEIEYDGSGDSGEIHSIMALIGDERVEIGEEVASVIDEYASGLLSDREPGWENNEGAFGEIVIDVAQRQVTLEHSTRYETYEQSTFQEVL